MTLPFSPQVAERLARLAAEADSNAKYGPGRLIGFFETQALDLRAALAEIERLTAELSACRGRLAAVLKRDAEWGLSGATNDCGCIRLSRKGEREYETGTCPHQLARALLPEGES